MKVTFEISDGRVVASSGRDNLKGDNYERMLHVIALHIATEQDRLDYERH